jgi:hypothetical protein
MLKRMSANYSAYHGVDMKLNDKMIEAGAEYLCGYPKEKAIRLEEQEKFQDCCYQAKELFNIMLRAESTSEVLQEQLAAGEPVNNNPHMW